MVTSQSQPSDWSIQSYNFQLSKRLTYGAKLEQNEQQSRPILDSMKSYEKWTLPIAMDSQNLANSIKRNFGYLAPLLRSSVLIIFDMLQSSPQMLLTLKHFLKNMYTFPDDDVILITSSTRDHSLANHQSPFPRTHIVAQRDQPHITRHRRKLLCNRNNGHVDFIKHLLIHIRLCTARVECLWDAL